jgi:DNA-binding NarL/FixJ family response regulator
VICTYPADARPSYIAANLLRRIDETAFRRHRRRASFTPWPTELFDQTPDEPPSATAADELCELIELAAADGWSTEDLTLIRRLADGEPTRSIASQLRVTDRMIRYRRATLTRRLADLARAS